MRYFLILAVASFSFVSHSQNSDSLLQVYKTNPTDLKVQNKLLSKLSWAYLYINTDSAILFSKKHFEVATSLKDKSAMIDAYNHMAIAYSMRGEYETSLKYNFEILKFDTQSKDSSEIAKTFNQIGINYQYMGDYPKALDYYYQALHIRENRKEERDIGDTYSCLGLVYYDQKDYKKGMEYLFKSLDCYKRIKDEESIAGCYQNLANIYADAKDLQTALTYYNKSYSLYKKFNNLQGISASLHNLGTINHDLKQLDSSLFYYYKAMLVYEQLGDQLGVASNNVSIGTTFLDMHKANDAISYCEAGLKLAKEIQSPESANIACFCLSEAWKQKGDYKKAYEYYTLYISERDSLVNETRTKDITRKEMQYKFDRKTIADSLKFESEKGMRDIKLQQEKNQRFVLYGGLILVIVFAAFMFNRFKVTKKQKQVIELQKDLVEEKNKEITDSINYAKRLQDAILPPEKMWKEQLPDSFILYKPKDIVAGDFYWMETISQKSEILLIAAADCTGHGVPGAMVSVVCSNALNRTVKEFGITDPGKILDKVKELVIETFEKSESEVKDGMDISLVAIEWGAQKTNCTVRWSGANNPLWYIQENKLVEIIANKQPIGVHIDATNFTTHTLKLNKGDQIYLFTDGYADQFGGPKGKKFKYRQLEELIVSVHEEESKQQKQKLEEAFTKWKGGLEQLDDVCIIGVRV
ncbi:MAG: tetratricopeptide repeat protein [Bacteroidia bacterium]|nr:tetratricopeptide repeat protein [Bacteroidia bacterium]